MLLVFFLFVSGCIENKPTAVTEINTPISTPPPKQYIDMDVIHFRDALNSNKLTLLQKQNLYNSFVGKYVKWKLQVEDVNQDSIKLTRIGYYSAPLGGSPRITLFVTDDEKSKLASLNKNDIITIEGMIPQEGAGYIEYSNFLLYINLYDGKIISKG